MPLTRARIWLLAATFALSAARAEALCQFSCAGTASIPAACCSGNMCTVDGTITVTGPTCDLNFGSRNAVLTSTGTINVASSTLTLEAGSLHVTGTINASGNASSKTPGGNVIIGTTGGAPLGYALNVDGAGASGILLTGYGRGGGSLTVNADGPVTLTGGTIDASGVPADAAGGAITIQSTAGTITIATTVQANGVVGPNFIGFGGSLTITSGGDLIVTDTGRLAMLSAGGDGGSMTLQAQGLLTVSTGGLLRGDALNNSGDSGGEIDITAGSVLINGTIQAQGGGDPSRDAGGDGGTVSIEALKGSLVLSRGTQGLTVDGAGGGGDGEVTLTTDSPTFGDMQIAMPISAQGFGGLAGRPGDGGMYDIESAAGLTITKALNAAGIGGGTSTMDITAQKDVIIKGSLIGNDPVGGGILTIQSGHDTAFCSGSSTTCPGTDPGSGTNVRFNATQDGTGGEIDISAGNELRILGFTLDVSGATGTTVNGGGTFSIDAGGRITVDQNALLNANSGDVGGNITLVAGHPDQNGDDAGDVQIDGQLTTVVAPVSTARPTGPSIVISGCSVAFGARSVVDSSGNPNGNQITGRNGITVNGRLRAVQSNVAIFPTGSPPPVVTGSGSVRPSGFTLTPTVPCTLQNHPAGCLYPCPQCGNGTIEFPEQCDPSGCPTCDIHCRLYIPANCVDQNACTSDTCDNTFGCINEPIADGASCDDGNMCTTGDACQTGVCQGAGSLDCDDGNPCTQDGCAPATGCAHQMIACPSVNCFGPSMCSPQSGCLPGPPVKCPSGQVCDPTTGVCGPKPCAGAAQCDDSNPCTVDTCSGTPSVCNSTSAPNGVTPGCTDADVCNGVETCQSGVCTPGVPLDCDDGNPCTDDSCDTVQGCAHTPIPGCCVTVNDCPGHNVCTVCTADHTCGAIANCCIAQADCDDGNECTDDSCNMNTNVCTHANLTGTACGDACNPGSTCQNGNCALSAPLQCPPDPDLCHPYRCDPVAGCVETAIAACCLTNADCTAADPCTFCDTGNVCKPVSGCHACSTNFDCDPCGGTMCDASRTCVAVTPLDCTNRYPNFYGACVLDANGTPSCQYQCLTNQACDDGNACNGAETCSGGTCLPGTAPECDDHEFCTDDGCDATAGCTHSQKTGFPSVRCHLDDADAALQAAGSADVSSAIRAKLGALFGKVRTSLGTAESTGHGKPALKQLKLTGKRLKAVGKAVHAAQKKKNKIASGLANTLLATVDGASQAVEALKPLITP